MTSQTERELLVALKQLYAEIVGVLGIARIELQEAIGNTNLTILALRLSEAERAIAKAEDR